MQTQHQASAASFKDESEYELFVRACDGDSRAFDTLMRPHVAKMRRQARLYFKSANAREDAEDVIQDTLIKVWSTLKSFKGNSKFSSWLYGALFRNSMNNLRKAKTERAVPFAALDDDDFLSRTAMPDYDCPARMLEAKQTLEVINSRLTESTDVLVKALHMYTLEQAEYSDIAKMLDCPMGTVKSRLHRARDTIKQALVDM